MFSQFFIAPLFTESGTDRELLAVDSEHSKNINSDMWRMYQLDKTTSTPSHPYHKFGTGSADTLRTDRTRDALLQFHRQWYSANLMTLCVVGKQSLDQLQEWVQELFSDVPNSNCAPPPAVGSPYADAQLGIQQWVVPVKDTHSIAMGWPYVGPVVGVACAMSLPSRGLFLCLLVLWLWL